MNEDRSTKGWINSSSFLAGIIASLAYVIMAISMFVAVVFRYALRNPLGWYEELTRFLLVWGAMLGMAYTLQQGRHIRVTTLVQYFPLRTQRYLDFVMDLVGIAVLSVFTVKGAEFVYFTHSIGEVSPGPWGFPLWWAELGLPVGGALFILQYLPKTWADLKAAIHTKEGEVAVGVRGKH